MVGAVINRCLSLFPGSISVSYLSEHQIHSQLFICFLFTPKPPQLPSDQVNLFSFVAIIHQFILSTSTAKTEIH